MKTHIARWRAAGALLSIALLSSGCAGTRALDTAPELPERGQPAPGRSTFVIVHGAWGGSWDWRTVDSLLTARGHRVHRPDLTGLGKRTHLASPDIGLAMHARDVINEILWEQLEDVVLVGHSYGGMVISAVADSLGDRIRELVYVDALLPRSGESAAALLGPAFQQLVESSTRDGMVIPTWVTPRDTIPHDVPHPLRTLTDTVSLGPRFAGVPGRYILTVEPEQQPDRFQPFAERAAARGWPVITMQADHVPERSQPEALVRLLLAR